MKFSEKSTSENLMRGQKAESFTLSNGRVENREVGKIHKETPGLVKVYSLSTR